MDVFLLKNKMSLQTILCYKLDGDILGKALLSFRNDCAPEHKATSIKAWLDEFGVEELNWPAQNPQPYRARPSHPTSMSDLTNTLLEEWANIPTDTLQNLVESFLRRVEVVLDAKVGQTPY